MCLTLFLVSGGVAREGQLPVVHVAGADLPEATAAVGGDGGPEAGAAAGRDQPAGLDTQGQGAPAAERDHSGCGVFREGNRAPPGPGQRRQRWVLLQQRVRLAHCFS